MTFYSLPRISIVTISYNQGRFLDACLQSIEAQIYGNLQHVVVDGGSTDESVPTIMRYAERARSYHVRWLSEQDNGPADGLNKGFNLTDGDVLGFINADDMLLPGALQSIGRYFSSSNLAMVQGGGIVIDERGSIARAIAPVPFTAQSYVSRRAVIFQPALFFRRNVFDAVGGFNRMNHTCWDAEFFLDASLHGYNIGWLPELIAGFRLHPESKSGSQQDARRIEPDRERLDAKCRASGLKATHLDAYRKRLFQAIGIVPIAWSLYSLKRSKHFRSLSLK